MTSRDKQRMLMRTRVNEHMSYVKPIPKGFVNFVNEEVLDAFLFYNNTTHEAYCTHCRKVVGVPKLKHNSYMECPECGHRVIAKSQSMSHKKPVIKWSVLAQKKNGVVVFRYFRHTQNMENYENPIVHTLELYREVATATDRRLYMYWDGEWQDYKKRGMYYYSYTSEWWMPQGELIYRFNHLNELLKGTVYQYSCLQEQIRLCSGYWLIVYLRMYIENPYIEQLIKVGFNDLVKYIYRGWHGLDDLEFRNGRTIMETLGVGKMQYKQLLRIGNPRAIDVQILQKCEYGIDDDNYEYLRQTVTSVGQMNRFNDMVDDMNRIVRYLRKQAIALDLYADYIVHLNDLGYPMENYYKYPKNFREANDRVLAEVMEQQERIHREQEVKMNKAIQLIKDNKEELFKRIESLFSLNAL